MWWIVLVTVVFFMATLLIGMLELNRRKESNVGGNIAVGLFLIALSVMSFEYYKFKLESEKKPQSYEQPTSVIIDRWNN